MATKKTDTPAAKPDLHVLSLEEFDEVLERDDLGSAIVPMPEWGPNVAVRIRGLSMDDLWETRKKTSSISDQEERIQTSQLEWILRGVVEPKLTADRVQRLRAKSSDAVQRLINRIYELNGGTTGVGDAMAADFPADSGS